MAIKKCHSYHCGKWKITSHQYYLDPQRSGHSLFVSGHIQCILSLVLLCLKNMVLYLSPVLAKCAIDLRVTTIRGYYTQDHLYSKDAVRYTKIVKHHDSSLNLLLQSQPATTKTHTLLKVTTCLYCSPNIRARRLSTLIAVSVIKDTVQKIAENKLKKDFCVITKFGELRGQQEDNIKRLPNKTHTEIGTSKATQQQF